MEWLVKNAVNRDVERQHLNKILQEIKSVIKETTDQLAALRAANGQQDIQTVVGAMVTNNTERGVSVNYNEQKKTLDFIAKEFSISLKGAVTGIGTVTGLGSVVIDTVGGAAAPNDGAIYWQHNGEWEIVLDDYIRAASNPVSKTLTYDGSDRLSVVTDERGTKTMTYDGSDRLTSMAGTGEYLDKSFTYTGDLLTAVTVT